MLYRYDVFEVELPNLHYVIKVNLLGLETAVLEEEDDTPTYAWKVISNFTLSPDKTSGKSENGMVCEKLQCKQQELILILSHAGIC